MNIDTDRVQDVLAAADQLCTQEQVEAALERMCKRSLERERFRDEARRQLEREVQLRTADLSREVEDHKEDASCDSPLEEKINRSRQKHDGNPDNGEKGENGHDASP